MNEHMKTCSALLSFALVLLTAVSTARAEDSLLEKRMETLAHAFKAVQKQFAGDSRKEAALAQIEKMKKAAIEARDLLPRMIAHAPQNERADLKDDYKVAMDGLIRHIKDLETAVRAGKKEDAQSILREIEESRRDGHASFRRKGDDDDE